VTTLIRRYPALGPARVLDALSFAYDNLPIIEADIAREQRMFDAKGGPSVGARPLAQLALPFEGSERAPSQARSASADAQFQEHSASAGAQFQAHSASAGAQFQAHSASAGARASKH
jgi:hypothetical protein